ncbi:MAG: hypothetical protein HY245_04465, partial [Rhizobiales bacterium]|nr:hypothetical protein [Hyphomicrobiales bacterium]
RGVAAGGRNFDLSLSTGVWRAGQSFRLGFNLKPSAGADVAGLGYVFNFDGAVDGTGVTGAMRLAPAVDASGKGDAEGELRPFQVTANVTADFDHASLDKIEFSPLDPKDGGTAMTGNAVVTLGSQVSARADFTAAKLDLGEWAGAGARALVREGGALGLADGLLGELPANVDVAVSAKVTALMAGRDLYENVTLRVDASRDAIRVRELSGSLPGRSRALFDGVFFPGKTGAELAGNLAVESNDMRQFAGWIWPEMRESAAKLWTGSRGRLKLQTEVSLTAARFRLSNLQYEIDGVPGKAELAVTKGGRGSVDLRIDADRIDLDNFMAKGISAISSGNGAGISSGLAMLVPQETAPDLRLTVQAGSLLLNGVEAEDVAIDLASGSTGLDLRTLEIGAVGGAKLQASGLILDAGQGPDGSIGLDMTADDPTGLLRLLGIARVDDRTPWLTALGKTAFKGTLAVKPGKDGTTLEVDASGSSGPFDVTASGTMTGGSDAAKMTISGTADLKAKTSAALAALVGLTPAAGGEEPARLVLTSAGTATDGFVTDLQVQAFGARFNFNGTAARGGNLGDLSGKVALRATDATALLATAGLPAAALPAGVVVIDSEVKSRGGAITLAPIAGRLGQSPLSGTLTLAPGGVLTGNLETGPISLTALAQALFLSWNGTAPGVQSALAANLPFGLTGEVWIKPQTLVVQDGFAASDAQIGITATADAIHVAAFGKGADGRDAAAELSSSASTSGDRAIDGKITLPVDLAAQLRLVGGAPIADGTGVIELRFTGSGRTPGGALAGLSGSGTYTIDGLRLRGISPVDFGAALANTKDSAGLTAAFDRLRGGEGLTIGRATGTIAVVNGIAGFLPITAATPGADVAIKTSADLAEGAIDIAVGLTLKSAAALPAMEVAYGGPPLALARSEDKAALSSKLGMGIMRQGVAELERLQQEQVKLAAEEELQRRADEAKLQAYYAQRDELLLRRRELKVNADLRLAAAERLRFEIAAERAANADINRIEIKQRQRELKMIRRLAKLANAGNGIDVMDTMAPSKPQAPAARVEVKPVPQEVPLQLPPYSPSQ